MIKKSKLLAVFLCVVTALFILTVSIAVPILLRPFYYWQIGPLGLEAQTGLSRSQIITAYDEMMDFCTGIRDDFSVGGLAWSQSGRDHFVDVRFLFRLDLWAAAVCGLILLGWTLVRRRSRVRPYRFMKRGFPFWGSVGLGGVFAGVGALAAVDFQRAFVIFHALFFPGKDNWIFDWRTDPVILILPQEFFRNCAIAILVIMLILCAACILHDLRHRD